MKKAYINNEFTSSFCFKSELRRVNTSCDKELDYTSKKYIETRFYF